MFVLLLLFFPQAFWLPSIDEWKEQSRDGRSSDWLLQCAFNIKFWKCELYVWMCTELHGSLLLHWEYTLFDILHRHRTSRPHNIVSLPPLTSSVQLSLNASKNTWGPVRNLSIYLGWLVDCLPLLHINHWMFIIASNQISPCYNGWKEISKYEPVRKLTCPAS